MDWKGRPYTLCMAKGPCQGTLSLKRKCQRKVCQRDAGYARNTTPPPERHVLMAGGRSLMVSDGVARYACMWKKDKKAETWFIFMYFFSARQRSG